MSTQYTREDNDIMFSEDYENLMPFKVAVIDKHGTLRMAKGHTDHKEAVEAFLEEIGDKEKESAPFPTVIAPDDKPLRGERIPDFKPLPYTPKASPECPPEDPNAGDKTPAVIEWHRQYHPEAFKPGGRYYGRKGSNLNGNA